MSQKTVTVEYEAVSDEDGKQAVWFQIDGKEVWIPRSVIYEIDTDFETVELAEWKAIELEIV